MGRWGDGEMGRWGDGEMGGQGIIKTFVVFAEQIPCFPNYQLPIPNYQLPITNSQFPLLLNSVS
ncbi:hypothetical protein [Rivularia sp. UHCC 0363]|uniref:hypothetical protein n=1 Tax=Rivularia sp. UHCC 0363 TaxID=3110244 RepID=UPI002B1E93F7|nr:hypothetical protein [Rivularia sp. UHCC 0363]MEA5599281.1 hypothetical protein [Rivularia sp. UHCC 0363]